MSEFDAIFPRAKFSRMYRMRVEAMVQLRRLYKQINNRLKSHNQTDITTDIASTEQSEFDHCPGFYEIEFQRIYRLQGYVLYKLRHWYKQLDCYRNKYEELQADGIESTGLRNKILRQIDKIEPYEKLRVILEEEKEAISANNPANAEYAKYERIIQDAYERAYANQQ